MSTKRKIFIKSDLTIPMVEHERVDSKVIILPKNFPPAVTAITFPPEVTYRRTFDFAPWYGVGIDSITYACQKQIERFLAKQDAEVTPRTVVGYCTVGLKYFLSYIALLSAATEQKLEIDEIGRDLIDGFISTLDADNKAIITKKNRYQATKSVLQALGRRGLFFEIKGGGDDATFPANPFPGADGKRKGERPLPTAQRKALSAALIDAVRPLFLDTEEPTSYVLSYALLIIALHTGRNTTPLLEMRPNCLRPHPKANLSFLVLLKRRGYSISKATIRDKKVESKNIESLPTLKPTVVMLVRRILELSKRLRSEAPTHFKDRVWLYRMRSSGHGMSEKGKVHALSEGTLQNSIRELVKRYNLRDIDGRPLRVNISRLRKTFVNRIFELVDGDLVATAAAAGNTVRVTSVDYLRPGEDAKKNWKFMGVALTNELLTNTIGATEKTPMGQCSDNTNGAFAPKKDGGVCMNFFNCVRCRNYVVTADDLYRLFSFYWRIWSERNRMSTKQWNKQFRHIVRIIDRDVIDAGLTKGIFKRDTVERERERAKSEPHPFWGSQTIISDIKDLST